MPDIQGTRQWWRTISGYRWCRSHWDSHKYYGSKLTVLTTVWKAHWGSQLVCFPVQFFAHELGCTAACFIGLAQVRERDSWREWMGSEAWDFQCLLTYGILLGATKHSQPMAIKFGKHWEPRQDCRSDLDWYNVQKGFFSDPKFIYVAMHGKQSTEASGENSLVRQK